MDKMRGQHRAKTAWVNPRAAKHIQACLRMLQADKPPPPEELARIQHQLQQAPYQPPRQGELDV